LYFAVRVRCRRKKFTFAISPPDEFLVIILTMMMMMMTTMTMMMCVTGSAGACYTCDVCEAAFLLVHLHSIHCDSALQYGTHTRVIYRADIQSTSCRSSDHPITCFSYCFRPMTFYILQHLKIIIMIIYTNKLKNLMPRASQV